MNVFYGVPFTDQLGYSPEGGSGWCTLKVHNEDGEQNVFAVIFGNDLWIYLTFITVTILYVSVHCHIKFHVSSFTYSYYKYKCTCCYYCTSIEHVNTFVLSTAAQGNESDVSTRFKHGDH